jgi:hypothetical protein
MNLQFGIELAKKSLYNVIEDYQLKEHKRKDADHYRKEKRRGAKA